MGISDNTQSIIMLISGILIAVGATSIPAGAPPYMGVVIMILGAIGMAIKDKLGAKSNGGVLSTVKVSTPPPDITDIPLTPDQ